MKYVSLFFTCMSWLSLIFLVWMYFYSDFLEFFPWLLSIISCIAWTWDTNKEFKRARNGR